MSLHNTTSWREWLGWFGSIVWVYAMINGYEYLMKSHSEANVYWVSLSFKLILLLSIIGFGYKFNRDPDGLGKIAHYTAPVAFLLTIGFSFVPLPFGSLLYAISPAFFAPALVRRVYGAILTSKPGYTFTFYMLAIGLAFPPMNVFIDYFYYNDAPLTIAYASCSVFTLIAWVGIRRHIGVPECLSGRYEVKPKKSTICFIVLLFLVACWLFKMKSIVAWTMEQFDDFLYIPVYIIFPGIFYVLFGYLGDKKREKPVFLGVFVAYLVCLQLVFLLGDPMSTQNKVVIPLVILNHLAGNIIEYFLYIIPIYFFVNSKRPVFIAPLGVASYLAMRTVRWALEPFLPEATHISNLTTVFPGIPQLHDFPLFVSTAVSAIVFFFLISLIYERYRERTLAASLYSLLRRRAAKLDMHAEEEVQDDPDVTLTRGMVDAGLSQEEIRVALLLIEDGTKRDIARKLHMSVNKLHHYENAIRRKLNLISDHDPVIDGVTAEYKLTRRETQMLRYLRDNVGNDEIAAELYLSEETVKGHVRNLLLKLSVEKRHNVSDWLDEYGKK